MTIAGTLFTDAAGSGRVDGATIHVIDATGADITMRSRRNGTFWTDAPVVFPLDVRASSCPDNANKVVPVTQAEDGGNCNRAGCHGPGSRVHLP